LQSLKLTPLFSGSEPPETFPVAPKRHYNLTTWPSGCHSRSTLQSSTSPALYLPLHFKVCPLGASQNQTSISLLGTRNSFARAPRSCCSPSTAEIRAWWFRGRGIYRCFDGILILRVLIAENFKKQAFTQIFNNGALHGTRQGCLTEVQCVNGTGHTPVSMRSLH